MMKKIPYKLLAVSTFLTLTTTSVVSPVATFASEIEQTNNGESLSANEVKMKETLQKAGLFAKSMNIYSYMLIKNPDVNFEGITLNGYENLPGKIVQDQKNARAHAITWDTQVKKQLLDTLTGIVEYDTTFDAYYGTLVAAADTAAKEARKAKETGIKETQEAKEAKETLKEGITDLRGEIQQNQKGAQKLIEELTKLRDAIGQDVREFGSDKDQLQSILKNQGAAVEEDEKRLNETLEQINKFRKMETDGIITVSIPTIPTWIAGGITLGIARDNLGKLEPLLAQLRQTIDYKVTLNRVVGVAFNNISEMHKALDDAINSLTYMSAQWHDLDSQYSGLLGHIDNASEKADHEKFTFLKANLNAAQNSWKTLRSDAKDLKDGIKELKVEPITPQQ